jgi:hypothetical protein
MTSLKAQWRPTSRAATLRWLEPAGARQSAGPSGAVLLLAKPK